MADTIKSIDELRKAQAAAQAQGTSITNYDAWASILEDFEVAGIQSTGTYEGDVKQHEEMMEKIAQILEMAQELQRNEQALPSKDENVKVDNNAGHEREQNIKANIVNATSSAIMADYMKYYHLLS